MNNDEEFDRETRDYYYEMMRQLPESFTSALLAGIFGRLEVSEESVWLMTRIQTYMDIAMEGE
jgi:hypothetical protein